jgi:hypothetical protein
MEEQENRGEMMPRVFPNLIIILKIYISSIESCEAEIIKESVIFLSSL